MARLAIRSVLAGVVIAAGLAACTQTGKTAAALQPVQGQWRIVAASNGKGMFMPLVGTEATITGDEMMLAAASGGAAAAGVDLALELKPRDGDAGIWKISLRPVQGPTGWSMHGIAKLEGDVFTMHVAKVGDMDSNLTDFLPRDDNADVVVLRKQ